MKLFKLMHIMLVLALDAMDSSGEQHLEISHTIYKRRLDLEGNPLEEPKRENITIRVKNDSTKVSSPILIPIALSIIIIGN